MAFERGMEELSTIYIFSFCDIKINYVLVLPFLAFLSQSDDRDSKRDSLEEGELRDHRMEITIRNSPYRREDSMEDR